MDDLNSVDQRFSSSGVLVYVVYKQGAFGQGVHGISFNFRLACNMANTLASRDADAYHDYDVYGIPFDELPPEAASQDFSGGITSDFGWMNAEPLYSTDKDHAASDSQPKPQKPHVKVKVSGKFQKKAPNPSG